MRCTIRYIYDHVAVYSPEGEFLFSADNRDEALTMMEEYIDERLRELD